MGLKSFFLKITQPKKYQLGIDLLREVEKGEKADVEKVKELVSQGAPLYLIERNGDVAVMATASSRADILQVLIDSKRLDVNQSYLTSGMFGLGSTRLMDYGLYRANVGMVLLNSGFDVNAKRNNNYTYLMEASYISTYMHISGSKADAVNLALKTLELTKDVNAQGTDDRKTALFHAMGCEEVVNALIARKADINIRNIKGDTALMNVLHYGAIPEDTLACVKVLVAAGIDLSIKNNNGETALDLARKNKHAAVVTILEEALKSAPQKKTGNKPPQP